MIHLSAWMHWRALTLTRRHKPLLSVHCRAKLSLQTAPLDPWTKTTRTHTSIPVHPLWFSATGGIWWNSAQVCMLSRGLQHSSPHREPRTSQILPGITPLRLTFSSSFQVLLVSNSLFESPCTLYLLLPLFITCLPAHLFLFVLPPSLVFLTLDLWAFFDYLLPPLLFSALWRENRKKGDEEHRKKKNKWMAA